MCEKIDTHLHGIPHNASNKTTSALDNRLASGFICPNPADIVNVGVTSYQVESMTSPFLNKILADDETAVDQIPYSEISEAKNVMVIVWCGSATAQAVWASNKMRRTF